MVIYHNSLSPRGEKITQTLFSIANAVSSANDLDELYASIYMSLNAVIHLPNFFIALVDRKKKRLTFPFFIDERDTRETIAAGLEKYETSTSNTSRVIFRKKPLFLKRSELQQRQAEKKTVGSVSVIWIGVPLIVREEVIGVMVIQHYSDPDYFTQDDVDLLIAVSDQVALAIDRQQFQEDLKQEKARTEQINIELQNEINERRHSENINRTLYAISNAVNVTRNLEDLYQRIHRLLGDILDVTNLFIAIVDKKEKTLYFPYFVDTKDDDFAPIINFNPEESLSGLVVTRQKGILLNAAQLKQIKRKKGSVGPISLNWMGVPLMVKDEVIGLIAVQSYTDPDLYTEKDLKVLSSVSDQVAIAIDRKRAEDELRLSERRYRHLFDNAPVPMYEIDFIRGRFISVNKVLCTLTGYTEDEFLSTSPISFFTEPSRKKFLKTYHQLEKGIQPPDNIEYEIWRKDGQVKRVVFYYDFIFNGSEVKGAHVVVHDITERKKVEEMMIQSEKMMSVGGLAAGMAHEINNPLAGIMQNAQVLLNRLSKGLPVNEKEARKAGTTMTAIEDYMKRRNIRPLLENIHSAGSNAATIVNNMLSFARKNPASKSEASLPELIEKTIQLAQSDYDLKKKYDFKQIEIIREYDPSTPPIACEESKILQVIFNIVKNAAEAMYEMDEKPTSPRIRFKTYPVETMVQLEIEDNGPGIDSHVRKRIFEPFFTTKSVDKGTGLGLSLSYFIIVDDHGGEMKVESTVGTGTTFIIRLPAHRA